MDKIHQINILLNIKELDPVGMIEILTQIIGYVKLTKINEKQFHVSVRYVLRHSGQARAEWNLHLIWPCPLNELVDFLERFARIVLLTDETLRHISAVHSVSIFKNFPEPTKWDSTQELLQEMRRKNIQLIENELDVGYRTGRKPDVMKLEVDSAFLPPKGKSILYCNEYSTHHFILFHT